MSTTDANDTNDSLTTITGIGPATAEKLTNQLGYSTASDLLVGYLTTDAGRIERILRATPDHLLDAASTRSFTNGDLSCPNVPDHIDVQNVMMMFRKYGAYKTGIREDRTDSTDEVKFGPNQYRSEAITPHMVDWENGAWVSADKVVCMVAGEPPMFDLSGFELSVAGNVWEKEDDVLAYTSTEYRSLYPRDAIEFAGRLYGFDPIENPERIELPGDTAPCRIKAGENVGDGTDMYIAPKVVGDTVP